MDQLNQVKQQMLDVLLLIQANGPFKAHTGLCDQLEKRLPFAYGMVMPTLREMFYSWPLYSGDETFPVPHPKLDPEVAYLSAEGSIWSKRSEYGRNRWSLLEHCISQLQIQLSKTQVGVN